MSRRRWLRPGVTTRWIGAAGGGNTQSSLLNGLVEYWKLDETTGTRIGSHNAFNLDAIGSPTYSTGLIGNALMIDPPGSSYLTNSSNIASFSPGNKSFTICYWIMTISNTGVPGFQMEYPDGTNTIYLTVYDYTTVGFRLLINFAEGGALILNTGVVPTNGVWYFVRGWWDNDQKKGYVKINEETLFQSSVQTGKTPLATQTRLCTSFRTSNKNYKMDGLGYWLRVLTDNEGLSLYNGGAGKQYPF